MSAKGILFLIRLTSEQADEIDELRDLVRELWLRFESMPRHPIKDASFPVMVEKIHKVLKKREEEN